MTAKTHRPLLAAALLAGAAVAGQASAADNHVLLQGFWEPRDHSVTLVDKPELTAEGQKTAAAARVAADAKDGVGAVSRYCLPEDQPWNLYQSAPIDIVQDARETTMMFEHHGVPYHIYNDGRGHPDAAHLIPQQNGHSIGHWDGDTFVVDSIGFVNFSSPGLQGGVPKTPTTHIVARFTPDPNGQVLHGRFTADDARNLVKPYSWDVTWYRSEPGNYAHTEPCDPRELANSHY